MEKLQVKLSFKNAAMVVCFFNFVAFLLLLRAFFSTSSSRKLSSYQSVSGILPAVSYYLLFDEVGTVLCHTSAELQYIKESEAIRRAMEPLELKRRVEEIQKETYVERETVQQEDNKQTTAVNLVSRLNNFRSFSDAASLKALEEWRKRKMERARQRELGKNVTVVSQS